MARSSASRRLARRSTALAGLIALCAAGTAHADITGTVRTPAGLPVAGQSVRALEPDGSFAASATTNAAGQYTIPTSQLSFDTPPFTLTAENTTCRNFGEPAATATGGPVDDGAAVDLTLDARLFCDGSSSSSNTTGHVWAERGLLLAAPGGTFEVQVQAPFVSTGYQIALADGTLLGGGTSRFSIPFTAPPTPYDGPINLLYTEDGVAQATTIGHLRSAPIRSVVRPAGNIDLLAIVDLSGSMSGTDPGFRRKTAVQLLIDLANIGDRLAAVGFDSDVRPIFGRTTVTGNAVKNRLKRLGNSRIRNLGGTDYNDGFAEGWNALTADPLNPQRPKAVIFLTDGGHNSGAYQNAHLRFAFNDTGAPWPVCVVQLGRGFSAEDVARLRRIAQETGGIYARTATNTALENLYFRCFGRNTGERTVLNTRPLLYRVGQTRSFARRIPARQRRATFFVSFDKGRYRLVLRQPGGRVYTRSVGKRVRLVRGKTFAFFRVNQPKAGRWTLRVRRLPTGGRTDLARTSISLLRR